MTKHVSEQALRLSALVRQFAHDVCPSNFRAYKHAMLAQRKRKAPRLSKIKQVEMAVSRPEGASLAELMSLTGWQAHSVRGAISRELRKRRRMDVVCGGTKEARCYRLATSALVGLAAN